MITPSSKPRIYFNEILIGTANVRRSNNPRHFMPLNPADCHSCRVAF